MNNMGATRKPFNGFVDNFLSADKLDLCKTTTHALHKIYCAGCIIRSNIHKASWCALLSGWHLMLRWIFENLHPLSGNGSAKSYRQRKNASYGYRNVSPTASSYYPNQQSFRTKLQIIMHQHMSGALPGTISPSTPTGRLGESHCI